VDLDHLNSRESRRLRASIVVVGAIFPKSQPGRKSTSGSMQYRVIRTLRERVDSTGPTCLPW
jgi:hypothetical protein